MSDKDYYRKGTVKTKPEPIRVPIRDADVEPVREDIDRSVEPTEPSFEPGDMNGANNEVQDVKPPPPPGYHYMPDGTLMSDEEHAKLYGRPVNTNTNFIRDFEVPTSVNYGGGVSKFKIIGDTGSKFRLEIKRDDGNWYDWDTRSFSSTQKHLTRSVVSGEYTGEFHFAAGTRSETFVYWLFAINDECGVTKFADYVEVRDDTGAIDVNNSVGSNSNLWKKEQYQGPVVDVTVSSIAPTLSDGGEVWNGATHSSQVIGGSVDGRRSNKKGYFKLTVTAASGKAIKIDRQPKSKDACVFVDRAIGAATPGSYTLVTEGEDIWSGTARSTNNVGGSGGGTGTTFDMAVDIGSPAKWAIGDRVTGNVALAAKTGSDAVYVTAINVDTGGGADASKITLSESVTIANGTALTFTPPQYHRWTTTNIVGLVEGSIVKNSTYGSNDAYIAPWKATETRTIVTVDGCNEYRNTIDVIKGTHPSITPTGSATATAYGRITERPGQIIFSSPHTKAFESTTHRFYSYGERKIAQTMRSESVRLTNLKAEIETDNIITTTISDASADGSTALNDFDVASINGIMDDVSVVSGPNITISGGEPTVTTISSANVTLTPGGHYVQNGQTLTFSGAASVVTITGNIEINDIGDASTTIYLDVEKFLTCA